MDAPESHDLDRLTLLERAQLLHDSTMRRYGEHLDHHAERLDALQRTQDTLVAAQTALHELVTQHDDRMNALHQLIAQHDDRLAQHDDRMNVLYQLIAQHDDRLAQHDDRMNALHQLIAQHDDRMAELRQILAAIKDLLERRNGH